MRVVRDGAVIYETTIASLKRFKDDVREVQEGFECGILLEGFNDVKEGDVLEAYETRADRAHRPRGGRRQRRPAGRRRARRRGLTRLPWAPATSASSRVELHFPDNHSLKGKRKELCP